MNGTYTMVYSGAIGLGFGVFTVVEGKLTGHDCGGGKYSGTVTEDAATNNLTIEFDLFIPRGLSLVQGTSPLEFDATKRVTANLPPKFGDGRPVDVVVPPGIVTDISQTRTTGATDIGRPRVSGFIGSTGEPATVDVPG